MADCGKFSVAIMMDRDESIPVFHNGAAVRIVELFAEEMRGLVEEVREAEKSGVLVARDKKDRKIGGTFVASSPSEKKAK